MSTYRIFLQRKDGRIFRGIEVAAQTDDEALQRALELAHEHGVEVWQEARMVGTVAPPDRRRMNGAQQGVQIGCTTDPAWSRLSAERQAR